MIYMTYTNVENIISANENITVVNFQLPFDIFLCLHHCYVHKPIQTCKNTSKWQRSPLEKGSQSLSTGEHLKIFPALMNFHVWRDLSLAFYDFSIQVYWGPFPLAYPSYKWGKQKISSIL